MATFLNRALLLITVAVFVVSCDSIETKKITSSQYLAQDWEAIDLTEVEEYPTFETCDKNITREDLKKCFEDTVQEVFYESLGSHSIVVSQELNDTIYVDFIVNEKGKYCIDSLKVTQDIREEIPLLEQWIYEAAKDLPLAEAATKRGIPVKTRFKIPVILKVE